MNFGTPYFIDARIEELVDKAIDPDTGEIIDEDALNAIESLQEEKDAAIEQIGLYYKDMMAEAEAIKTERANLLKRQQAAERKAENISKYMTKVLKGSKFKTPLLSVSYRNSEQTIVDDITKIPYEYLKFKDPEPDKTKIKDALKKGIEVEGAHIEPNVSTIIR